MRVHLVTMAMIAVLPACESPSRSRNTKPDPEPSQATQAPQAPPATSDTIEPEPLPDSWKRFFLDQKRFSAQFPAQPKATDIPPRTAYEAHNPAGSLFMVVCGPASTDHEQMLRNARAGATTPSAGTGPGARMLSESHPDFFGTSAYQVQVRLPDKAERFMLFVEYGGRYCTPAAELMSDADETQAMRFIQSFRPEPTAR